MQLHERLRELFRTHELSQSSVAKVLNVSASTVSGWLGGGAICSELQLARVVTEMLGGLPQDDQLRELGELLRLREEARLRNDSDEKWTPQLRAIALKAWATGAGHDPGTGPLAARKTRGRTLLDFPEAFHPLTIVNGDKREDSVSRLSPADFGVVSASPAESRWIARLRLPAEVELLSDKITILEDTARLKERFAERNLIIIGSPASNHLARRCHLSSPVDGWRRALPIFRFNVPQSVLKDIESFLASLEGKNGRELLGVQANYDTYDKVKHWVRGLFGGGIIDPTYKFNVRAENLPRTLDFGLISLGRNPFADDDRFVAIHLAGFHLLGTAHAIRMLSDRSLFEAHQYGGVLRVTIDKFGTWATPFDESDAIWDAPGENGYTKEGLISSLSRLAQGSEDDLSRSRVHATPDEFREALDLVNGV